MIYGVPVKLEAGYKFSKTETTTCIPREMVTLIVTRPDLFDISVDVDGRLSFKPKATPATTTEE